MAEPTKADLDTRLRDVEKTAAKAEGSARTIMWLVGILLPVLISLFGLGFFSLLSTIGEMKKELGQAEGFRAHCDSEVARLQHSIERLEDRVNKSYGTLIVAGEFVRIAMDKVYLKDDQGQDREYPLAKDVKVLVKGKAATLSDLKPKQAASFVIEAGRVIRIEVD